MNKLTEDVALNAVKIVRLFNKNVNILLKHRLVLEKTLYSLDFVGKVFPSDSSFVFFRLKEKAKEVYETMVMYGVITRYRGSELH